MPASLRNARFIPCVVFMLLLLVTGLTLVEGHVLCSSDRLFAER